MEKLLMSKGKLHNAFSAYLIHTKVYSCIGNDSDKVWHITAVETPHTLFGIDLLCAIRNSFVLACFP